jgi:lipopolysaccharide biosynthesis glycosyltransferase
MPKISVLMPCYNRSSFLKKAINSILNQTYKDFEFIIIDDCSTDKTPEIVKKFANKDARIIFLQNEKNMKIVYSLNRGLKISKGEYIARMDSDDISFPDRFEKQVAFMDNNQDIAVAGTFIELVGDFKMRGFSNWITETEPDKLALLLYFFNPLCHPSVMIRTSFLRKNNMQYNEETIGAEDYCLWKDIVIKGGKLANLPEKLLYYRVHNSSFSQVSETQKIQIRIMNEARFQFLNRFLPENDCNRIMHETSLYPLENNRPVKLYHAMEQIRKMSCGVVSDTTVFALQEQFCGKPCTMDIFFASNDAYAEVLCVAITSILTNSLPMEKFNFYILDGGISKERREIIESLKEIKPFEIEFIVIDNSLFENCIITDECLHISKQTYYRYLIPKIKPNIEKLLYLDCDVIVEDSLNKLWDVELSDNYTAAVRELFIGIKEDEARLNVPKCFNAGVMLINNKKWVQDGICDVLFSNTEYLAGKNKIRWVDQDVLNYTLKGKVLFLHPKYNLQQNAFFDTDPGVAAKDVQFAASQPVIVHFNGYEKPWTNNCRHSLWQRYYHYWVQTPYGALPLMPYEQNTLVIVLAASDSFVPHLSVMMQSVMETAGIEKKYHFYIIHKDISPESVEALQRQVEYFTNFKISFLNMWSYCAEYNLSYFCLLIPYLFKGYEKVVYLDSDMYCCADIALLFEYNLGDNLIGAITSEGGGMKNMII